MATGSVAYTIRELSSQTFSDFEKLAAKQGGCWCMHYQRTTSMVLMRKTISPNQTCRIFDSGKNADARAGKERRLFSNKLLSSVN